MSLFVAQSPQDALPGFAAAFDEEAMKGYMQAALFGTARPTHTVERCTPTRPLYKPGECCLLRYRFAAKSRTSGEILTPIVIGRVFPSPVTCAEYMNRNVAPLVTRMRGRPEVAAFAAPAAVIDTLNMVVHLWPIDPELPTLVDATDRERMMSIFGETLPETMGEPFVVTDCEIELVSYRRRQRCVLRYTIVGKSTGSELRHLILYGKVSGHANETLNSRILDLLRAPISRRGVGHQFALPRSFGSRSDLRLSLLEAIPGEAQIGAALKARLRGAPSPTALSLETMIATCGEAAAMLHTSGVGLGSPRTLDEELAGLQREIATAQQFAPAFADRAQSCLDRIAASAAQSEPLRRCLSHGDFKYEQLLFAGDRSGLVDFDMVCQAEPALDLGQFLAHLQADVRMMQRPGSGSSSVGEELAEHFLRAYVGAAGDELEDERQLRLRVPLYESVGLLRLALRSGQDLNETRAEMTTAVLEERLSKAIGE